jgi:hypothetical protein
VGSNPASREFCAKNDVTCDFDGDGRALAGGALPQLKEFVSIFFMFFFVSTFAECWPLSSVRQKTPGKNSFADAFFFRTLPSATVVFADFRVEGWEGYLANIVGMYLCNA